MERNFSYSGNWILQNYEFINTDSVECKNMKKCANEEVNSVVKKSFAEYIKKFHWKILKEYLRHSTLKKTFLFDFLLYFWIENYLLSNGGFEYVRMEKCLPSLDEAMRLCTTVHEFWPFLKIRTVFTYSKQWNVQWNDWDATERNETKWTQRKWWRISNTLFFVCCLFFLASFFSKDPGEIQKSITLYFHGIDNTS